MLGSPHQRLNELPGHGPWTIVVFKSSQVMLINGLVEPDLHPLLQAHVFWVSVCPALPPYYSVV